MRIGAAPEAAAGEEHVELDLLGLHSEDRRDLRLVDRLELLAVPDLAGVRRELHDAVHRFHAGVREIREFVGRLERLRRAGERSGKIAFLPRGQAGRCGKALVLGHDLGRAQLERARLVPLHGERVAALFRGPEIAREHRHALGDRHHVDHALHRFRFRRVEGLGLSAEARRMRDEGREHPGELHVLRVNRRAVRLGAGVGARQSPADQGEILRVLELHVLRDRNLGRARRELAEGRLAVRRLVHHRAARDRDRVRRDVPALGRRGEQHRSRRGARLAHLLVRICERGAAARALHRAEEKIVVAACVRGRAFDPDLAPVGVELLGDERRQARVCALAHLEVLHDHGDRAVRADANEGVGFESAGRDDASAALAGHLRERRHGDPESEPRARLEEVAPAEVDDSEFVHAFLPARHFRFRDACLTARLMRL